MAAGAQRTAEANRRGEGDRGELGTQPVRQQQAVLGDGGDGRAAAAGRRGHLLATAACDEEAERRPLKAIATEVAERTEIAAGVPITVTGDDSAARVYPGMIRRAVQNLVDNAVKYGAADGPIRIEVDRHRVTVIDEGPGIPPEDLDHVFDRFFRSPKARSRPGNGIGLAIVKQVADVHGGSGWAENGATGGALVGFSVDPDA